MAQVFNPSREMSVKFDAWFKGKFQARHDYLVRPCLENKLINKSSYYTHADSAQKGIWGITGTVCVRSNMFYPQDGMDPLRVTASSSPARIPNKKSNRSRPRPPWPHTAAQMSRWRNALYSRQTPVKMPLQQLPWGAMWNACEMTK